MAEVMQFEELRPEDQNLKTIVGLAVGAASVCWDDMTGKGVFESERAQQIVEEVISWIEERYQLSDVKAGTDERPFGEVGTSPILRYFVYDHLPERLQQISRSFAILAWEMEGTLPPGPEKSTALRKLLESKDAAVRAALDT